MYSSPVRDLHFLLLFLTHCCSSGSWEADPEMELSFQEVYWSIPLGSTPMGKGKKAGLGRGRRLAAMQTQQTPCQHHGEL